MFGIFRRAVPTPAVVVAPKSEKQRSPRERTALSLLRGDLQEKSCERLVEIVAQFPHSLLHQLHRDGVSFTTSEAFAHNSRFDASQLGAGYDSGKKVIFIPERHLFSEKAKRLIGHEVGHAVDHQLKLRETSEDVVQRSEPFDRMNSTDDRRMKKLFREFSARQLCSEAVHGSSSRSYPGAVYEVRVASESGATSVVQEQQEQSGNYFKKREAGWGLLNRSTFVFNGHKVSYRERGSRQSVTFPEKAKLPTLSWLSSHAAGQYIQQTGREAELFADGVGAYLNSPEQREALSAESHSLYDHIQGELERYY